MIELELKYQIERKPDNLHKFELIKEKDQSDIYYDTKNYDLLRGGNFLRVRNSKKLEFKVDLDDASHLYCKETSFEIFDVSNKISEINKIFKTINVRESESVESFEQFIKKNELQVLAPINKHRTDYRFNSNCIVSIDEVDRLGMFLEAEILINKDTISLEEAKKIKEDLINQLLEKEIIKQSSKIVNVGYVEIYLLTYNKMAYELGKFKI